MRQARGKRNALGAKLMKALFLFGAVICVAGSPWEARGAAPTDRSGFQLGGWATGDLFGFDPFDPYGSMVDLGAPASVSSSGSSGDAARPMLASVGFGRPPPRIPYRPPLRTPYKPPWP